LRVSRGGPIVAAHVLPHPLRFIGDTLITRAAQVAMKERMRRVLCVRETPLSTVALENAARLSRDGLVIMPISPPW
jgi:3-polyprenyl-4-hydroxybenzoate decarboxylase